MIPAVDRFATHPVANVNVVRVNDHNMWEVTRPHRIKNLLPAPHDQLGNFKEQSAFSIGR